jgi:RHS repeat-associated protein
MAIPTLDKPGATPDTKNPTNAYRYGGKRFDSGSGTMDTGARRFGSDTAHFLQQDVFHGALSELALGTDPCPSQPPSLRPPSA